MSNIRELSVEETKHVAGGPAALLPVIANLAMRVITNQLAKHAVRSTGLVGATYKAADSLSDN